MNIRISMTRTDLELVRGALSCMDDNEHDKGANDDCWQGDLLRAAFIQIDKLLWIWDDAAHVVPFDVATFGLILSAVEIYCTDDDELAARALAARFLHIRDIDI